MINRQIKRIIIILIYLLIFAVILTLVYLAVKPKPSCNDGKMNQEEEGVDCGGPCQLKCNPIAQLDIRVDQTGFVDSGIAGKYDIYGKITNPNSVLGSNSFQYEFKIKNSAGAVIDSKTGTSFILPGDSKYIIEGNVNLPEASSQIELSITNTNWIEKNDLYEAPQIKVVYKNYNEVVGGLGFFEATGLLKNESALDFNEIKLKIILTDELGRVVALNSTEMNTVKTWENRDFKVSWPNRFPGSVANMNVQIEVNVFDSAAFVRQYFKPQKFQNVN